VVVTKQTLQVVKTQSDSCASRNPDSPFYKGGYRGIYRVEKRSINNLNLR